VTDIGLSEVIEHKALGEFFTDALHGLHVIVQDVDEDMPSEFDVCVSTGRNSSEFPLGLLVVAAMRPGADYEVWLQGLARALSACFAVRSICDGSRYGKSASPCWSILWDRGVPHLADDSETVWADGEGGPVRIVRALQGDEVTFASARELVEWVRP
jgi:hypothetical protein